MLARGDGECRDRDGDGHRVHQPCAGDRSSDLSLDLGCVQRGRRGCDHLGGGGGARGCWCGLGLGLSLLASPVAGDDGGYGGPGEDGSLASGVLRVLVRWPRHVHVV